MKYLSTMETIINKRDKINKMSKTHSRMSIDVTLYNHMNKAQMMLPNQHERVFEGDMTLVQEMVRWRTAGPSFDLEMFGWPSQQWISTMRINDDIGDLRRR